MSTKIEIRTLAAELRADDDDEFQLVGVAAAYNSLSKDLGGFREIISPGAFKRSLDDANSDVVCLFNHDSSKVLGRTRSGTLKLKDSAKGLTFRCQLDEDQQMHRDLYASVKRGDISECSFAFTVNQNGDVYDTAKDGRTGERFHLRTLRDVNLHDVSAVTTPAYGNGATSVSARGTDYITEQREYTIVQQGSGLFTAELASIAKQDDELLRLRLARIGAEIAREK